MNNLQDLPTVKKLLPGEMLQMLRKRANLSQTQLAIQIGLQSKRMVQNWEAGENTPKSDRLRRLIEFYLERQIFSSGRELKEAQQLWNSIKNHYEANSQNFLTYPVFDQAWFEAYLQNIHYPAQPAPSLPPGENDTPAESRRGPGATNLPATPGPLIGREKELAVVARLLRTGDSRLVTLYGSGGTGKTCLALHLATHLSDDNQFRDGVYWVKLAALRDTKAVIAAIAQALALKENSKDGLLPRLKQFLRNKHLLMVLDNFEQVIEAAPVIAKLLEGSPFLKIIVTSRAILRLYKEQSFLVPPLGLPAAHEGVTFDQIQASPAVELFVAHARLVGSDFELTPDNAPVIGGICIQLDGLPLALELAAARLKFFTPQQLLKRLHNRLDLLTNGPQDQPPRHRTLEAAIQWSYDLLEEAEKRLFRRLGVFSGGMFLAAIEQVCEMPGDPPGNLLADFESLLDKSLVKSGKAVATHQEETEPHFSLLETLREYALKRLTEEGELDQLQSRHAAYYLYLAEEAEPRIRQLNQEIWLEHLAREHLNLQSALEWFTATRQPELALRLAGALWWFWNVRGYITAGLRWLQAGLDLSRGQSLPVTVRAKALHGLGVLMGNLGNYTEARFFMEQVLELRRGLDDKQAVTVCLHNLGVLSHYQDDYPAAVRLHEESLALKRELDYTWGIAHSLDELGTIACIQGDYARAERMLEESRQLFQQLGDKYSLACVLGNLGKVLIYQTDYHRAAPFFEEGLRMAHELGNKELYAEMLNYQGLLALYEGQLERASQLFEQNLRLAQKLEHLLGLAHSSTYLGLVSLKQGDHAQAESLLRKGLEIKIQLGKKEALIWNLEGLALCSVVNGRIEWAAKLFEVAQIQRDKIGAALPPANRQLYEPLWGMARLQLAQNSLKAGPE